MNRLSQCSPAIAASRRRSKRLAALARDALFGAPAVRYLTPLAWAMIVGLGYFLGHVREFGGYAWATPALFLGLLSIALFDARYLIIPTCQAVMLAMVGLVTAALIDFDAIGARVLAGVVAFGLLRAVGFIYGRMRGVDGLGLADADLLAAGAVWVGFDGLGATLLYAVASALLSAAIMRAQGQKLSRRSALPFGPHLAAGIWLVWIFGPLEFAIG